MTAKDFCFIMRRIDWEDVAQAPSVVVGYLSPIGVHASNDDARKNLVNAIRSAQKVGAVQRCAKGGKFFGGRMGDVS